MLPETLLCLLNVALAVAQTRQQLNINSFMAYTPQNNQQPPLYIIPPADNLTISIALCAGDARSPPSFYITNTSSDASTPGSSSADKDVYTIVVNDGYALFMGPFTSGGILAAENAGDDAFQVGVSDGDPVHRIHHDAPLLGDSTANQVLIYSPPFLLSAADEPSYPNYTLPAANRTAPEAPASPPQLSLIISPTSSNPDSLTEIPQTGCQIASRQSTGTVQREISWLRDESDGWRREWIVGGLTPSTNYTAYVVWDSTLVSGPLFFVTKSDAFSCALVTGLPYCPSISYAVPLPPPPGLEPFYTSATLPPTISDPLISGLTNFSLVLSTFACGRDLYSPLVTCADCQAAYRKWLCTISFTRCSEQRPGDTTPIRDPAANANGAGVVSPVNKNQQPFSALIPQPSAAPSRNPAFPPTNSSILTLLPCLEICLEVDRACPSFLNFRCPLQKFNAAQSYGVGYMDRWDGEEGKGLTGGSVDRWGNIWCNK